MTDIRKPSHLTPRTSADWEKIGKEIQDLFKRPRELDSAEALDTVVERLTSTTANTVDKHTPDLRPSPYSKRWFTADLKAQLKDVNRLRHKWQESCVEVGRADSGTMAMFEDMRQSRRAWTRTIEKAKTSHWKQFLDEAGEGKLWKAATYMKPRDPWGCIPALKIGDRELVDNAEKAQAFMGSFFPSMAPAQEGKPAHVPRYFPDTWSLLELGQIAFFNVVLVPIPVEGSVGALMGIDTGTRLALKKNS
jgi:hypothetical protein